MKNEMVERYVYDVVRRLPEKQRQDIKEELITLIEDMLEERMDNGKGEKENVEAVLRELGAPAALADKYRGEKQYLIGGEYYSTYLQVLKIVLICVVAGMLISAAVSFFVHSIDADAVSNGLLNIVIEGFVNIAAIPGACIGAFGLITLIFAIMERNQVKLHDKTDWKLGELPQIPKKKSLISRGDSVAGIVFTVLGMILLICVPELFGAWLKNKEGVVVAVPVFNMEVWNKTLVLIIISMVAGLVDEVVKLIKGRYCLTVLWTNIVTGCISIGVAIKILADPNVWNQKFWTQIGEITGETLFEIGEVAGPVAIIWQGNGINAINVIMLIVIFASVLEIGVTCFRTWKYGMKK